MKRRGEQVRGRTLEARLLLRIQVGAPGDCWPCAGARDRSGAGYPSIGYRGGPEHVHRVVCRLAHGLPPRGAEAMHSCDNKVCCNPRHLSWGTHAQNMADAAARKRWGPREWRRALAAGDFFGASVDELAARFGVSRRTVQRWRAVNRDRVENAKQTLDNGEVS